MPFKNAEGILEKVGLGEVAKRHVGTGENQIPDMSAWSSAGVAGGGWSKSPDGIITNYGYASAPTAGPVSIAFPAAFPHGIRSVSLTPVVPTPAGTDAAIIGAYSNYGMTVHRRATGSDGITRNGSWDFFWRVEGD